MAGGHGFPRSRLDFRGRQALLQAISRSGGKSTLEDLESLVFGPWHGEFERREETGIEADWSPHLQRLRSRCGGTLSDRELLETWFRPYGEQLVPTEGARETLEEIRAMGPSLALVSNVPLPGELYSEVLARHGLKEPFDSLCFSYDKGSRKPSPALLRLAMAEVGADPIATLMVGDRRERDIAAGRFAGTGTVWIRSADHGGPEPDVTIGSLLELPDLLRQRQR
jgi:HAD superfamily hydrolase (TIGR01509 family)